MKTVRFTSLLVLAATLMLGCSEDVGTKGRLRISISDSPLDELPITAVNFIITNFEAQKDGIWRTFRSFDQPVGVNLLELTGGKSFTLIDQFVEPGVYTAFRFSLMVADPGSAVLRSPLSTIDFQDGTSKPIFLTGEATSSFSLTGEIVVNERGVADYNFDVDVRKSFAESTASFTMNPVVRLINVTSSGTLAGRLVNAAEERLLVFAYPAGKFALAESQLQNGIRFRQAIASGKVVAKRFQIGFLEEGSYDLVFVRLDTTGKFAGIRGLAKRVDVAPRQTATRDIDMKSLSEN